jgi:MinD superfamily P-loop ATPase
VLARAGAPVTYVDCDVEEPNGRILLHPTIERSTSVEVPVPLIDSGRCTNCGECAGACQYGALASLADCVLTFPELCHGCGSCSIVCPEDAIAEVGREIGTIDEGRAGEVRFAEGRLLVGEARATPVIRALRERVPDEGIVILDSPPGTSCPVIETLRGCDRVVMVTEPTPFGLFDLRLAVEAARALGLPISVVVNRSDVGDAGVHAYCCQQGLPILARFPHDRDVAEAYARGALPAERVPAHLREMEELADLMVGIAAGGGDS